MSFQFDHTAIMLWVSNAWSMINYGGYVADVVTLLGGAALYFIFRSMGDDKEDEPDV